MRSPPAAACRPVVAADHDAVIAMMVQLYVEDPSPEQVTPESARRTLVKLADEPVRGRAVALLHDGDVAGYALLCSFWSNELGGEVCVVDELYMLPAHRGRGLASWLVRSLQERALPWFVDAVAIELEVTPANARARALYERLGFRTKKNAVMRALLGDKPAR